MTWRLRAGPASFRGVPFQVDSNQLAGGRKTVVHEYPLRDDTFVEDLGERGRAISVRGYVVGNDYIEQRDSLIEVLQQPGPGRLSLPYLAVETRSFMVSSWSVEESREEGGIAYILMEFLETAPEPRFPAQTVDLTAGVDTAVADVFDAAEEAYDTAMNPRGLGAAFLGRVSSVVAAAGKALNLVVTPVQAVLGTVTGAVSTVADALDAASGVVDQATQFTADIKQRIDGIIEAADQLVRVPFAAADRFREVFETLFDSPAVPSRNLDALLTAYEFQPETPKPAPTTSNRAREAANYEAVHVMVQRMTLATAARFAPRVKYDSYEVALRTRERIAELIDAQIETADDNTVAALSDLRAALVVAVPGDQDLPRLLTFTPPTTLPSLVIAHRVYGNVDKELELVARNRIRHPGFVVGGGPLEVLTDA